MKITDYGLWFLLSFNASGKSSLWLKAIKSGDLGLFDECSLCYNGYCIGYKSCLSNRFVLLKKQIFPLNLFVFSPIEEDNLNALVLPDYYIPKDSDFTIRVSRSPKQNK